MTEAIPVSQRAIDRAKQFLPADAGDVFAELIERGEIVIKEDEKNV